MFVQDPEVFEDLHLPLRCQILVFEEDNTAIINQCGELIQLLVI